MENENIDILIIGSGGAGLSAALEAKKENKKVLVVSKTYPTQSQTSQAQGGINGVIGKNNHDTIQNHINDTLKSAHGLGDRESIEFMCTKANETITWLDQLGVPFSRASDNTIAQRSLGGASHPRACYSSDYTGLKILHTLYDNCIKNNIEFLNEHMLLNFIIEEESIRGIVVLDIQTSEVKQILAKCVIVASGGYGALYHGFTTNSGNSTGDSIAKALQHGIKVSNMEYIQFHPTALKGSFILISESARGEGGYLVTQKGERFVDELLPRDIVARAILEKIQKNEEVYLDLRHLGLEKIKEAMPQEYDLVLEFAKKRLDQDLVPIMPAAHYTMGGIDTDRYGRTSIKNLYAVGECSSNGVHGANRLGGNSLLEIVTFGRVVGKIASQETENIQIISKQYQEFFEEKKAIEKLFDQEEQENFYHIKKSLGELLYNRVGLFRDEQNLTLAYNQIKQWQQEISRMGIKDRSRVYNTNLKDFLEFKNLLTLGEVVTLGALERKESRGAHYRVDYPQEEEQFSKRGLIVAKKDQWKVEYQ